MTFLQPFMLWGLPLLLLPLLIHLLNRMRYQSMDWAAIMFLLKATRSSTRFQKWRHILILLCRMLAIGAVVLALSRPLVTGWLGVALSGPPDTIIMVLDRSASMEATEDAATRKSKRERAIELLASNAERLGQDSRLVLIESATGQRREIASPSVLKDLTETGATDTAAHFPSLMQVAHDYIVSNQTGTTEIWIASDMQASNWQPDSSLWQSLNAQLATLPQRVRIRLLALNAEVPDNAAVAVREAQRNRAPGRWDLDILFEVGRTQSTAAAMPVTLNLDGEQSTRVLDLKGRGYLVRHKANLGAKSTGGWGYVELPVDSLSADNRSHFVYGKAAHLHAVVVSDKRDAAAILVIAAAPAPELFDQSSEIVAPGDLAGVKWPETAMVVWQAPFPAEGMQQKLREFVESGGVLVCFPPAAGSGTLFGKLTWGEAERVPGDKPFTVSFWDTADGPLAKTASGAELPVGDLRIVQRRAIKGAEDVLAEFKDGEAFLSRLNLGRGRVLCCASLPQRDWSNLSDGTVLVPMMQRLLMRGGQRLASVETGECGSWALPGETGWLPPLDTTEPKDYRFRAGVYMVGKRMVALNRPAAEDQPERLDRKQATALFGDLPVQFLEEARRGSGSLQSELWRFVLSLALLFLVGEAFLLSMDYKKKRK